MNAKGIFHEIFYIGFKDAVKTSLGIFKGMLSVWMYRFVKGLKKKER